MKWEIEKTWDLDLRIKKWEENEMKFNKNKAANISPSNNSNVTELQAAIARKSQQNQSHV